MSKKPPSASSPPPSATAAPAEVIARVPVAVLVDSPFQPRQTYEPTALAELTASIQAHGLLQPLVVRPVGGLWDAREQAWDCDRFELVCGHRRLRAAKAAGLTDVTVVIRPLDDLAVQVVQDIENAKRADLSAVERSASFQRLRAAGQTLDWIARETGTSEAQVRELLLLVKMPAHLAAAVEAGRVSPAAAAVVCRIPDDGQRDLAAWCVILGETYPGNVDELTPAQLKKRAVEPPHRPFTRDDVRELVGRHFQKELKGAPFPTKGRQSLELLPDRPGCDVCPDRAGVRAATEPEYKSVRGDTCLDIQCFRRKTDAFVEKETARIETDGGKVMNKRDAHKAFPYSNQCDSIWVDLDCPPTHQLVGYDFSGNRSQSVGKQKALADALESVIEKSLVHAVCPHDNSMHRLIPATAAKRALTAAGVLKKDKAESRSAGSGKVSGEPGRWDIQQRVEELAFRTAFDRVHAKAGLTPLAIDKFLARVLLDAFENECDLVKLDAKLDDPYRWLESAEPTDVRALSAALAASAMMNGHSGMRDASIRKDLDTLLGKTEEQITDQAKAELVAERSHPKPAATANGKPVKTRKGAA